MILNSCVQVTGTAGVGRHMCTHQILNFTLKHGVHSDDEGSGRAQHLQQPWGQDRDVWVAEHRRGHNSWSRKKIRGTKEPFTLFMSFTLWCFAVKKKTERESLKYFSHQVIMKARLKWARSHEAIRHTIKTDDLTWRHVALQRNQLQHIVNGQKLVSRCFRYSHITSWWDRESGIR